MDVLAAARREFESASVIRALMIRGVSVAGRALATQDARRPLVSLTAMVIIAVRHRVGIRAAVSVRGVRRNVDVTRLRTGVIVALDRNTWRGRACEQEQAENPTPETPGPRPRAGCVDRQDGFPRVSADFGMSRERSA